MPKDYSGLFKNLLPEGPAWNKEVGSKLSYLLTGMSGEWERIDDHVEGLVYESNPLNMSQMLPVRYEEAGLPNPCAGKPDSIQQQKSEVITQWAARGGQSIGYFQEVANTYGYQTVIKEYDVFHIEQTPIETLGFDDAYVYAWELNYVDSLITVFRASQSSAQERLVEYGLLNIDCIFELIKPAHTTIVYVVWDDYATMIANT